MKLFLHLLLGCFAATSSAAGYTIQQFAELQDAVNGASNGTASPNSIVEGVIELSIKMLTSPEAVEKRREELLHNPEEAQKYIRDPNILANPFLFAKRMMLFTRSTLLNMFEAMSIDQIKKLESSFNWKSRLVFLVQTLYNVRAVLPVEDLEAFVRQALVSSMRNRMDFSAIERARLYFLADASADDRVPLVSSDLENPVLWARACFESSAQNINEIFSVATKMGLFDENFINFEDINGIIGFAAMLSEMRPELVASAMTVSESGDITINPLAIGCNDAKCETLTTEMTELILKVKELDLFIPRSLY